MVTRVDADTLKEELFEGIPNSELSVSSKRKLNLILGVHCDNGKTIVRQAIKEEMQSITVSLDYLTKKIDTQGRVLKTIKEKVGGMNGKS